ncbi:cutinase family protein [Aeromicrobium sp. 636]|nr:cutinase family protein [Aeromicrobium sp. 636]
MSRMLRQVTALALACIALASCSGGASDPSPGAQPSDCPTVQIIGLRGQGQSLDANGGLGTEVRLVSEELADDVADLGPVRTTAIRHQSRLGGWDDYLEDVADGRARLGSEIRSIVAACPDALITVLGFSQGSQIAQEELADTELARHVDALVLVGSPLRDSREPFMPVMFPGGIPSGEGRLAPGPDLGHLGTRTVAACITGDAVCAGGSDDTIHREAYEDPKVARAIADSAASLLRR